MAMLNKLTKIVAKPIPRMVTPKAHALIDYATVGLFLGFDRLVLASQPARGRGLSRLRRRRTRGHAAYRLSRWREKVHRLPHSS